MDLLSNEKYLMDFEDKFLLLNQLYKKIPQTKCIEACGIWCCTKLKHLCDKEGNFISLPLVYSIEFENIRHYIKRCFTDEERAYFSDIKNKSLVCLFRDQKKGGCLIHEARPFSCRVYGHRVPPVFWGIEYPAEMAENIYCKDMEIVDYDEVANFLNKYRSCWDQLAILSRDFTFFSEDKRKIIKEIIGVEDIKIFGWFEYNFLLDTSVDWLKEHLADFWKIHGALL
ncbi:YkgJ family cysteine cluster protein [Candidatus Auribacterota bacterium]